MNDRVKPEDTISNPERLPPEWTWLRVYSGSLKVPARVEVAGMAGSPFEVRDWTINVGDEAMTWEVFARRIRRRHGAVDIGLLFSEGGALRGLTIEKRRND